MEDMLIRIVEAWRALHPEDRNEIGDDYPELAIALNHAALAL